MHVAGYLVSFGLLMIAMSVHEFAHGWVAYKLGDTTARDSGRLTLNPLAHIDPIGTILLPLSLLIATGGRFVFGAAKPVPINYSALRNPKRDVIWVGASGPLVNLAFALVLSLAWRMTPAGAVINFLLLQLILINIVLGIFNLVPIPPLDGSRILMGLLPRELSFAYASIEPWGFIIVLALVWMGLFEFIVWPLASVILGWLTGGPAIF